MSVLLHELPDYRPNAKTGWQDRYLRGKSTTDASKALALGGNLIVSPEEVAESALQARLEIQAEQGVAPYVSALATLLKESIQKAQRESFVCKGLARTALTDLFRDSYGVAIDKLTKGRPDALGISYVSYPYLGDFFDLTYHVRNDEGPGATPFWQLRADPTYGFVNLNCVHTVLAQPLQGEGNISFIPGVEEALTADVRMLTEAITS